MAKKTDDGTEEEAELDPTENELAACAVVVELLRSGRILTFVGDVLVERVDENDFPGEPLEAVVTRRFCELTVPGLAEVVSAPTLWKTAALIESVRERIVVDFQLELEREQRRN